jgi:hypothetical protein
MEKGSPIYGKPFNIYTYADPANRLSIRKMMVVEMDGVWSHCFINSKQNYEKIYRIARIPD